MLPEERIGFLGDFVQIGYHPVIRAGTPSEWHRILDQVEVLGLERVITGHGPVGDAGSLARVARYYRDLEALARTAASADELNALDVPPAYSSWLYPDIFRANLKRTYESR